MMPQPTQPRPRPQGKAARKLKAIIRAAELNPDPEVARSQLAAQAERAGRSKRNHS